MSDIGEFEKFKDLLDSGAITPEEFEKKKEEILKKDISNSKEEIESSEKKRILLNKNTKIIIYVLAAVAIIVLGYFGVTKISSKVKENAICKEASAAIADLMAQYDLNNYKVTDAGFSGTKVLCADFEDLSSLQKYELIKETMRLSNITVKGEDIDLSCDFYINSRDYYYYVSPLWAEKDGNNYTCGGIYKNDGNIYCIYEEYWG